MSSLEDYKINLTTEPSKLEVCARMMSTSDPWITLGMDYLYCLKAFEGPCKEIHVIEVRKEIAGFVVLQICGTFKGYIQTICIKKEERGKGLGTLLLKFCEKRILQISPNVFICVSSFNKEAIRLYHELGFRPVGELENFVKEGFTELLLRKTVGPLVGFVPKS